MRSDRTWAEQVRDALLDLDRRRSGDGEVQLRDVRVVTADRIEITFAPSYLARREVVLPLDARLPFAADFLIDEQAEEHLPAGQLDGAEVAWRVYVLGMHEPFSEAELKQDDEGRTIRALQPVG